VLCVGALIAAIALASASGASVPSQALIAAATKAEVQNVSTPTAAETNTIYAQAMRAAEQANDPTPETVELAATTMGHATELMEGAEQPANDTITDPRTGAPWTKSGVFAIEMRGSFLLSTARIRKGTKPPSGTDLTLLIDRQLDKIVGVHVSDAPTDLHTLGTPVTEWRNQQ
jgi:hypothetical protein